MKWIEDLTDYGPSENIKIIIGNKNDLVEERVVSYNSAVELAKKYDFDYFEVSAKTGENVKFLFEVLTKRMIKKQEELEGQKVKGNNNNGQFITTPDGKSERSSYVKIGGQGEVKKKKCC